MFKSLLSSKNRKAIMIAYTGSRLKLKFTVNADMRFNDSANNTYSPTVQNEARSNKYPVSFRLGISDGTGK